MSIQAFIDRIEGDSAVVYLSDDDRVSFNLPLAALPEGASEGSYLQLDFKPTKKPAALCVDCVEDDSAVLNLSDFAGASLRLPLSLLPEETQAGSQLKFSCELDEAAALEEQKRAEELTKELTRGLDPNQTDFKL